MAAGCSDAFSIQKRSTAISPDPSFPNRIVSVAPLVEKRAVEHDAPALVFLPGSLSAARCERCGKQQDEGRRAHQIRPRPAFLMRPSDVSASTILSSTPLMNVLLPGVE